MTTIGPLVLKPTRSERIWGVRSLEPWFDVKDLAEPIGEMWLTDETCTIESGVHAGKMLRDVLPNFPLLMKVLFPADKLSVQVHPNDAEAQQVGQPRGKTECWYVMSAEPGASVAVGFKEPMTVDEVRSAIQDGTLEDKMAHLPVKDGDMVFVDAGTVHAIGPGVIILETQEYSDITYRLFDYGRPRALHLEQGLAVTKMKTQAGVVVPRDVDGHTELVRSDYFVVDRMDVPTTLEHVGEMQILIALNDGCELIGEGGSSTPLRKAHAVVLPGESVSYSVRGEGKIIRIRQ